MKKQNGITLIALVITIIVLLILAGVSIAMLTGDNGILNQATKAESSTTEAEFADKINMAINGEYTNLLADKTLTPKADEDAEQKDTIKRVNGLDDKYTVDVATDITQDGAILTISAEVNNKTLTGKITKAGDKYTITKAPYPTTKATN